MQKSFSISVVVPVLNAEKYIGRCIRSLKVQNILKNNYEIIIVDDGSTDNSIKEIKKQRTSNMKIIRNKKNLGLPASLNIGIRAAKGMYVVRVDADDWVHNNFLDILANFLFINLEIDAVACDYWVSNKNEVSLKTENCEKKPIGCGIMFRMQHLLDINLYDESFIFSEEKALRKEFLKKYSITRIPLSLYHYRQHEKNRTKNKRKIREYSKKLNE
tara:strand:+ start:393 stop:1040 length:648 start_codon:yes stop_codon:yes gene_type:complete